MSRHERLRALARRRHGDVAVAVVAYAVTLLTTIAGAPGGRSLLTPAAAAVGAVACGSLVWRRRWPFRVLAIALVGAEAYLWLVRGQEAVLVAPLVALYTVADSTGRRRAMTIGSLAVLAFVGLHGLIVDDSSWLGPENLALAALGGLAVAAGDASRSRRAYTAEVEERARRAELGREEEARRRVAEERLRIARDVHDSVGHHIALINVQAGVAAHVLDDRPAETRRALADIRQIARTALGDLRATIGLLRQPGDPTAPMEPALGLAALDELVTSFDRSGLRVERRVDGAVRPVPPAVDLTAYRVLQEALTNVHKHAHVQAADVRLSYRPTRLRIVVDNDVNGGPVRNGAAPAPTGQGHGIVGMRERVTAIGGELHAGRRPGGFRVDATLPLRDDQP